MTVCRELRDAHGRVASRQDDLERARARASEAEGKYKNLLSLADRHKHYGDTAADTAESHGQRFEVGCWSAAFSGLRPFLKLHVYRLMHTVLQTVLLVAIQAVCKLCQVAGVVPVFICAITEPMLLHVVAYVQCIWARRCSWTQARLLLGLCGNVISCTITNRHLLC